MVGFEAQTGERKELLILKVLEDAREPLGARVISRKLLDYGISLGERAVRYHLKFMDERGLTRLVSRDGRVITEMGREELSTALVRDKVGFAITKIELLAFRTTFDPDSRSGAVPVNVSFFSKSKFERALQAMKPAFAAGLCVSDRVAIAREGERLGGLVVPPGKVGLATVCSIVINGTLLKAGVPMDSRFGGIVEMRNNSPVRFVELIHYAGSSMDPSEVFIRAKMTSVRNVARTGNGKILANFREVPAVCRSLVEQVIAKLKTVGLGGLLVVGKVTEPVCEIPVEVNKIGMVLLGGLNPVAAAEEAGLEAENHAMSTVIEYGQLVSFWDLL